jgi:hypothetical protein
LEVSGPAAPSLHYPLEFQTCCLRFETCRFPSPSLGSADPGIYVVRQPLCAGTVRH